MHDPLVRDYILATVFHIPPDGCSAVELDDLLMLHGRVSAIAAERRQHG